MQTAKGIRLPASYVTASQYGEFKHIQFYADFEEFARDIARQCEHADILEPIFNGHPCMDELRRRFK